MSDNIYINSYVSVGDKGDIVTGYVESGHAGQWFVRTLDGELTGPWDDDQVTRACRHQGIAGMMHVHEEDLESTARIREVQCESCDMIYTVHTGWQLPENAFRATP